MRKSLNQNPNEEATFPISRRNLIKQLGKLGLVLATTPLLRCRVWSAPLVSEKSLTIYNIHTGESLKNCLFWAEGKLNPEAMKDLTRLFRDHRTNQELDIDPSLIHLLHNIRHQTDSTEMIHLISGYRSKKSNAMLRSKSCGVAQNSQHLYGKAADIMIPGRTMKQIQQAAKMLKAGGVGRYTHFVHVDTGRVRHW